MGNQFIMPKQVFYGENALKDAADVIATLGKKALVVTDPMMMKLGTARWLPTFLMKRVFIMLFILILQASQQIK